MQILYRVVCCAIEDMTYSVDLPAARFPTLHSVFLPDCRVIRRDTRLDSLNLHRSSFLELVYQGHVTQSLAERRPVLLAATAVRRCIPCMTRSVLRNS